MSVRAEQERVLRLEAERAELVEAPAGDARLFILDLNILEDGNGFGGCGHEGLPFAAGGLQVETSAGAVCC